METKHSGMGIAAFVISLLAGAFMLGLVVVAGAIEMSTPGGMDERSLTALGLGLLILLTMVADVVAAALGIAALAQRDRKKVFGILGLVFAVATLIGVVVLMIVGNLQ